MAEYYSVANVFVSPSVQETFGKTVAEAISCGTPVCVYNNTALPELAKEGCGAVVPVKDIQALAEHIRAFMSEEALCVVGNAEMISKAQQIFDTTLQLF